MGIDAVHTTARTLRQGSNADDNLNSISKARIEKTAQRLTAFHGQLFRRFAKQLDEIGTVSLRSPSVQPDRVVMSRIAIVIQTNLGKRNDGEETEPEAESSIPVKVMGDEAERDEEQEDVEP